jgi:nucleoside-diphosphate-sugar epimerase
MDVLVIGGNRFVGWTLGWRLLAAGHRVTLLNRGNGADPFGERVRRIKGDRTVPGTLEQAGAYDAIVDFAAYKGADARDAIDAFKGKTGHYVLISTGQVYLVREGCPRPAKESDYAGKVMAKPSDPRDHADWEYGVGKRDAEDFLAANPDFPSTRIRIPMVNGERDYQHRIEGYLFRILDGGPVWMPGGGDEPTRHVYSGSVAEVVASMLGKKQAIGQAFNLAQDETPTLAEILRLLCRHAGAPNRAAPIEREKVEAAGLAVTDVSPFSGRWMSFLDPSKAKSVLGFAHEPLQGYLGRIVSSFFAHPPPGPPPAYAKGRARELALG